MIESIDPAAPRISPSDGAAELPRRPKSRLDAIKGVSNLVSELMRVLMQKGILTETERNEIVFRALPVRGRRREKMKFSGKMTGKDLKEARIVLGLSQAQLGAVLGVTRHAVLRWERGIHEIPVMLTLALQMLIEGKIQPIKNDDNSKNSENLQLTTR